MFSLQPESLSFKLSFVLRKKSLLSHEQGKIDRVALLHIPSKCSFEYVKLYQMWGVSTPPYTPHFTVLTESNAVCWDCTYTLALKTNAWHEF